MAQLMRTECGDTVQLLAENTDFEPTLDEVLKHAEFLSMDLERMSCDLLQVVCSGLKAPLPWYWKSCQDDQGEILFFDFSTGARVAAFRSAAAWPADGFHR